MNWLVNLAVWLCDYYLAATCLMTLAIIAMWPIRQPARRISLAWGTLAGLLLLGVLAAVGTPLRIQVPLPRIETLAPATAWETMGVTDRASGAPGRSQLAVDPTGPDAFSGNNRGSADSTLRGGPPAKLAVAEVSSLLFLVGSGCAALWLAIGAVMTRRLRGSSRIAPPTIQSQLAELLERPQVATPVLLSSRVNQAVAVGVFLPQIILPERFVTKESKIALQAALAHELAHVNNGDLRQLACLRLLLPVMFAHPLYWWFRALIRIDQELLADAVAGKKSDVACYAEVLLDWFRTNNAEQSRALTATLGLWERPHLIKRRIEMLLNEKFQVETRSPLTWRVTGWSLLTGVAVALSTITLQGGPELAADEPTLTDQESTSLVALADDDRENPGKRNRGEFSSAEEAFRVGAAYYNSKNFSKSRKPFEAALKMAPDDAYRLKVYQALIPSYRELKSIDKMVEASEFIIRHAEADAKRSLTRRSLLSFVYQRGKIDVLAKRYEKDLKKNSKDEAALYILSELYARTRTNPARAAELTKQLMALGGKDAKVDVPTSAKLALQYAKQGKHKDAAELYEKIAPLDKALAAWHFKEAANQWVKLKNFDKALAAADKAEQQQPEKRSELLTHFFHRHLGEAYLASGKSDKAVPHFEKAIENTSIEGYLNDCKRLLAQAQSGT